MLATTLFSIGESAFERAPTRTRSELQADTARKYHEIPVHPNFPSRIPDRRAIAPLNEYVRSALLLSPGSVPSGERCKRCRPTLGDSVGRSIRMKFSVHTAALRQSDSVDPGATSNPFQRFAMDVRRSTAGFSSLICRINSRSSLGLPGGQRDFRRQ
jgi:hypothetical protein